MKPIAIEKTMTTSPRAPPDGKEPTPRGTRFLEGWSPLGLRGLRPPPEPRSDRSRDGVGHAPALLRAADAQALRQRRRQVDRDPLAALGAAEAGCRGLGPARAGRALEAPRRALSHGCAARRLGQLEPLGQCVALSCHRSCLPCARAAPPRAPGPRSPRGCRARNPRPLAPPRSPPRTPRAGPGPRRARAPTAPPARAANSS